MTSYTNQHTIGAERFPTDAFERVAVLMSLAQTTRGEAASVVRHRSSHGPLRRGGRALATVTLVVLAAFLLFVVYGSAVGNRWYRVVAINGDSMEPTFSQNDAIVITRPPKRIEPGMVLTLEIKGKVVTHRVVGFKPDGQLITKGDANTYADDWTGLQVHVVGRYRGHIPWIGRLLQRAGNTGAWFTDGASSGATATAGP